MPDLEPVWIERVQAILARHVPDHEAYAYGSRARGTNRPFSDLDLCLRGPPVPLSTMALLREEFEESEIPFPVDIVEWDRISERFRSLIEAEMVRIR